MAIKRVHAKISGRVQGIGYRYYAQKIAREMGISGNVRNNWDGTVEIVAEAEEGLLARFIGMLRQGPPRANVTEIDYTWHEPEGLSGSFYMH